MKHLEIALKEYGKIDIPGNKSNPEVLKYFSEAGFGWVQDDDTAWCAAFLNWVLLRSGLQGSGSLLARSFLNIGFETKEPKLGDIAVFWRININSIFGHCGLYIAENEKGIFVLGGNEDGQVKIKAYPKWQLLAYRGLYEN